MMDTRKLVKMSLSISNFNDHEINNIMQDEQSRTAFLHIMDCYKQDDPSKRLECILNKTLIKICGKENSELATCLKQAPKEKQKMCNPELLISQRCADDELHNILLVSRGMN